ncbi:MAG: transcription termination/antitermination protein NusA [Spirochaetales bacterium]|nr:transcription termination/antitermination protein NusA [Spirochaetales bacterium]
MSSEMAKAIKQMVQEKGVPEELILKTIEEALLAAYKKKYGIVENAVVRFNEDTSEVTIFSKKKIMEDDDVNDPVTEIALSDALNFNEACEIGDELLIEVNPKEFDRSAIQSAKQRAKQSLKEIQKDTLYSEFMEKIGEMVIGYYQRERNGNIYVDLGKTEGIMPKKYQSPREVYHANDRIKALIYEVNKTPGGLQIVLSRTHTEFVRKIFEIEVPEIYDHTVEIHKIVREPGYRTKIAVYSNREDVDPVGACVGLKGVRIQAIVKELEGEKIDILKYDSDPVRFIKNALSPAEVAHVIVLDEAKKQALALVDESQLSLAIGKQGLNVRLANRLVDWSIDVKTSAQFEQMDIAAETKRAVSALFGETEEEEIETIAELPGIDESVVKILRANNLESIEDVVSMSDSDLLALPGITEEALKKLRRVIEENIEIVEGEDEGAEQAAAAPTAETESAEEEAETEEEVEESTYECPECGNKITPDMSVCPHCGVGLSFEEADGESESEAEADSGGESPQGTS